MWGLEDGVAKKNIQMLWKEHLKIMKEALHITPKIPHTRQLWTKEQINILWKFYKNANNLRIPNKFMSSNYFSFPN